MYAVIDCGGHQYRVAEGEIIRLQKMDGEVGEAVTFSKLAAVGAGEGLAVDGLAGAHVNGVIVEQGRARKIIVFLGVVMTVVLIVGALMYLIEGEESGFTSIPQAMYWAIVTMTTVGYGDISPQTILGKFLAAAVMILGYGIIAVPTGIVSVEMSAASRRPLTTQVCPSCASEEHEKGAKFCKDCGAKL